MKVTLHLGEARDGGKSYGRIEDPRGTYTGTLVFEGRQPCVECDDGTDMELPEERFNSALVDALNVACEPIWGADWTKALAEICDVNPRSFSRDRLRERGLPPAIIAAVLDLASCPDAAALAYATRGLARYVDRHDLDPHTAAARAADRLRQFRGTPKGATYSRHSIHRLKMSE